MTTILISFVGTQDPYSDKNKKNGSILTLTKYLLDQKEEIKKSILLYTQDLETQAELTKECLQQEFSLLKVELIKVNQLLSIDPINLSEAINEAKKGLNTAEKDWQEGDTFAFNASSGTPVMKSSWVILQSAGYAPYSNVWQVRNPDTIKTGQDHVFTTNVNSLKQEFDQKIITEQINNYNYSGALLTLENSSLLTKKLKDLLIYGKHRLAFNFNLAYSQISNYQEDEIKDFATDITSLRQNNVCALLKEVYFKACIKLEQKEYSDFLIWLFAFQENLLQYFMRRKFLAKSQWEKTKWKSVESAIIDKVKIFDQGKLFKTLQNNYVNFSYLNRPMMMDIINYDNEFSKLLNSVNFIDKYASERNNHIHQLQGVEDIKQQEKLTKSMSDILKLITKLPNSNPFHTLNQTILNL
ncbi:MAG: hypothetical protein GW856_05380 [Cyanobacteria bacterium]|nr:hypothetical protein [Cyanobacteria bacterium CG_2015-16_32_12]NCO77239.1 hypothetical protein [Cyanobacteria bacterium CG_2015-22_32_23]NCQ03707.1 hypothetical protein [Cyanobacteria bacterium CG_2015-09_32_10]NCS86074.1 hypothetical protein [Cyanobacteria bacterium CG_2015-02_32_10]